MCNVYRIGEARCVKRSDLIQALADDLPPETIRFGCRIVSVKSDTVTPFSILHLNDATPIRAKVVFQFPFGFIFNL